MCCHPTNDLPPFRSLLFQAHAVASGGKPLETPHLELTFNRHNIDIAVGRTQVKLSNAAYAKLAELHRRHAPADEAAPLRPALPAPPAALYAEHARDVRRGRDALREAEAYWLGQLAGELPVLALPTDAARPPIKTYRGGAAQLPLARARQPRHPEQAV